MSHSFFDDDGDVDVDGDVDDDDEHNNDDQEYRETGAARHISWDHPLSAAETGLLHFSLRP